MEQRNTLRQTIEEGGAVFGARSSTFSPALVEVYGSLGIDFVWLDFEHMGPSPYNSHMFENLARAAETSGTELFVRLPSGDPPLIRKVLDAGVRNILIPRVDDATEVRKAVEATRFVYDGSPGQRGRASSRFSTWGTKSQYVQTEDEEVCLGVMIEKMTAVENLEEILKVPELGFVFIGPSDLAAQMGHPTAKNHPEVEAQIEAIETACLDADVPLGGIRNQPEAIEAAVDQGYQILRIGGDLDAVEATISRRLDAIDEGQ